MDSHMLDMAAKNRFKSLFRLFYRKTITPIIIKNRIPVIRTQDSDYVEKALGIPLEQAPWISTGSDTMLFKKDNIVRHDMRERIGIDDDEFVITYAGKLDEAKGGLLLADALIEKINADRKICFVVIGNTVGEYGRKVEDAFNKSKNRIIRFQTQKYNDLAAFFKTSDLVLFPKQCSLSFYDAQACGIPVLFENNEINIKRSLSGGAIMFEQENCEDLRNKIVQFINMDYSDYQELCDSAQSFIREFYDYKKICDIYLKVIADEIDKYKAYGYS
jgi:glycosyltransferase involved in cell wall biosynthesis